MTQTQFYNLTVRVLKQLQIPFVDPCNPEYTGDCSPCGAGDGSGGGGPYTVVETPADSGIYRVTDSASSNFFDIPRPDESGSINNSFGNTYVLPTDLSTGNSINFTVDGVDAGDVTISGGQPKWTLQGIFDPSIFRLTPITSAEVSSTWGALAVEGDIALDAVSKEPLIYDGTEFEPLVPFRSNFYEGVTLEQVAGDEFNGKYIRHLDSGLLKEVQVGIIPEDGDESAFMGGWDEGSLTFSQIYAYADGRIFLSAYNDPNSTALELNPSLSQIGVSGDFNSFKGLVYQNDYTDNFVDKSLITKEYVDRKLGWAVYGDSQYTEVSPLSISVGNTEIVDIDGLGNTITTYLPSDTINFYDTTTSKITPTNIGDGYTFTLSFKGSSNSNNGSATIGVDIGGAIGEIFRRSFRFPRGTNQTHEFYMPSQGYSLNTFVANGGEIKITSDVGTSEIWDISLQVHRTFRAES